MMIVVEQIVELKQRLLYIQRRQVSTFCFSFVRNYKNIIIDKGLPVICTHNVLNDADDEILCSLRRLRLVCSICDFCDFVNIHFPII